MNPGGSAPWNFRKLGTGLAQAACAEQGLGLEAGRATPQTAPRSAPGGSLGARRRRNRDLRHRRDAFGIGILTGFVRGFVGGVGGVGGVGTLGGLWGSLMNSARGDAPRAAAIRRSNIVPAAVEARGGSDGQPPRCMLRRRTTACGVLSPLSPA